MSTIGSTFTATGIWRGQAEKDGVLVAVRANLREDRGSLRGVMFFGDPGIGGLVDVGSVTGTRSADAGTWKTQRGAAVSGTFSPNDFAGVLQIPRPGSGVVQSALQLRRVPTRLRGFTPIAPGRLLDTRKTTSSPPDAGSELYVPVTGKQGIPFRDVGAVVVNITGTEALGPGFVTAWASGTAQPATSNLNLERAGQTAANLAIVPVGSDGYMKLFTQSGSHLVVDAFGWFSTESILQAPATPTRVLDTRPQYAIGYTGPKPEPGAVVGVSLAGAGGVPSAGVAAAVVNITATEALAPGYITAWATGRPQPFTSNLNVDAIGQTISNLAIVPVSADSSISLFTQSGAHLVVDVFGWFPLEAVDTSPRLPAGPEGSLISDGSFEPSQSIARQTSYRTVANDVIGAWMVTEGGVDIVGPGQGKAFDGDHFIDLNGNSYGPGALEQLVSTSPDRQYRISFRLAGNPNGAPTVKDMEATFGDARQRFSFDITGHTNSNLGWVEQTFVANPNCGSSTALTLRSLTAGDRGPNIDAVRVVDAGPGTGCHIGGYVAVGPVRLLDTRADSLIGFAGGKPGAGAIVTVPITGVAGIAAAGVTAVAVNVTATDTSGPGYVTAWPSSTAQPATSNLNVEFVGQTRANHAIVPVGPDGAINLFTQAGTHLIVDAFGWFS